MKKSLQFLLFSLALQLSVAHAGDPPPPFTTSQTLTSQGYMTTIPTGSYLQLVNFNQNWNNWYHEVQMLNSTSFLPNPGTLKVSQAYLNKDLSNTVSNNFQVIDERSGKTITAYEGQKYIVTGSQNKGWKTHQIHFVDDEGSLVDHKGIPTSSPRTYKTSQKNITTDVYGKQINTLGKIQRTATTQPKASDCPPGYTPILEPIPKIDLSKAKSSYEYLTKIRPQLRAKGNNACMRAKEKIQDEYMSKHPYGKLTLSQRADKIHSEAKTVLGNMIKSSGSKNAKSRSRYKDFVSGDYVDPVITPAVAACISYQETKGNLNPYAVNYTLCNKKMTSTAHGLGQITRTTLKGLRNNPDGDLLPLNTPISKKYKNMSTTEIHSKMSGDTGMQLEVLMRLLSSNAKFIRWKNKSLSEEEVLRRAVIQYDRDSASKYIQNVINNCLPCFNKGGDGKTCYKTVK